MKPPCTDRIATSPSWVSKSSNRSSAPMPALAETRPAGFAERKVCRSVRRDTVPSGWSIFVNFSPSAPLQMQTVPSSTAVRKADRCLKEMVLCSKVPSGRPVAGSHFRMVRSLEPLKSTPSARAKQLTLSECPANARTQPPRIGSHRLIKPLAEPVYTPPSSAARRQVTAESWALTWDSAACVEESEQSNVPSSPAVSRRPWASTMHRTGASCREIVLNLAPESVSQTMTFASSPALKRRWPRRARHHTGPAWPVKVATDRRVRKSHFITVLSTDPLKTEADEPTRQVTGLTWPSKEPSFFPTAVQ
mmetsp:Transcript_29415/g.83774  ORF Transcript_29415/g.83774 Transcript_29415/m.83774 type:complete len:306 (+) Transcript_29415:392-1309(+)